MPRPPRHILLNAINCISTHTLNFLMCLIYLILGSSKIMEVLTELKDADHTSPQYPGLIRQITANFDDFKDNGSVWGRGGAKAITRKDKDDQFIGYTYKRKKVCKV